MEMRKKEKISKEAAFSHYIFYYSVMAVAAVTSFVLRILYAFPETVLTVLINEGPEA